MVHGFGTIIWLCWIFFWLLPFVTGQSGGNGFGGGDRNPFTPGGGGFGVPGGSFQNGGNFGGRPSGGGNFPGRFGQGGFNKDKFDGGRSNDRQGDQQQEEEEEEPVSEEPVSEEPQQENTPESEPEPSSSASAAPAESSAAPPSNEAAVAPEASSRLVPAIPTSEAVSEQPSSLAGAAPTTTQPLAGIPLVAPSNTINNVLPTAVTSEQSPPSASLAVVSTVTTEMTVWTTTTPNTETSAAPAEENAPASTEASASPTLDLAPLSTSSGGGMSASEQAGMGVGITFGLLTLAGAAVSGIYVYRRRRNQRADRDNLTWRSGFGGLGGFFRMRSRGNSKNDPEWSIESASKIEIVPAGSAKSVRTGSRSDSPTNHIITAPTDTNVMRQPPSSFPMRKEVGSEVLRVGMKIPERKPNLALTSNPPISPSAFPSPPGSSGKGASEKRSEGKTGSWPLPD